MLGENCWPGGPGTGEDGRAVPGNNAWALADRSVWAVLLFEIVQQADDIAALD